MNEADKAVASLIWIGRVLIVLAAVLYFPDYAWTKWLGAALLLVFPAFAVIYWAGIRVRRPEVAVMTAVSLGLAAVLVVLAV